MSIALSIGIEVFAFCHGVDSPMAMTFQGSEIRDGDKMTQSTSRLDILELKSPDINRDNSIKVLVPLLMLINLKSFSFKFTWNVSYSEQSNSRN